MPARSAVAPEPLDVDDGSAPPVSLPRRVRTLARSTLPVLDHPTPRELERVALELLIAFEAVLLLVLLTSM